MQYTRALRITTDRLLTPRLFNLIVGASSTAELAPVQAFVSCLPSSTQAHAQTLLPKILSSISDDADHEGSKDARDKLT